MRSTVLADANILIADDSPDIRRALQLSLKKRGWNVVEASHGREAIEIIRQKKPDLLILDHRMPVMTGGEVYKELKRINIHLPVILITAAADIEALAKRLGANCYLGKPFQIERLVQMIVVALTSDCCRSDNEIV